MACFFPGGDVGQEVTDLQSISHVLAGLRLGLAPWPPAELTRSQQPGRPGLERGGRPFHAPNADLFHREPFLQGPADLLRAPPFRQALHDVMPPLVVAGKLGKSWTRPSLLCHFLGAERMITTLVGAVAGQLPADCGRGRPRSRAMDCCTRPSTPLRPRNQPRPVLGLIPRILRAARLECPSFMS